MGLLATPERHQVTGVALQPLTAAPVVQELSAALVVDASGRRSAAPGWLEKLGLIPPPEMSINPFLGYATRRYRVLQQRIQPGRFC